ncbi:MAG TPA: hypothetical protein VLL97_00030 [Acidobacteriota bacterium]|nr:hypothetical protein [Acidobacteriota bacterium]
MKIINEKSTLVVALSFKDEDGADVVPVSAHYRLDDVASGVSIVARTALTSLAATMDLVVTAAQNAIKNGALATERKRLTVEFTYGIDTKAAVADYVYAVKNLSGVE